MRLGIALAVEVARERLLVDGGAAGSVGVGFDPAHGRDRLFAVQVVTEPGGDRRHHAGAGQVGEDNARGDAEEFLGVGGLKQAGVDEGGTGEDRADSGADDRGGHGQRDPCLLGDHPRDHGQACQVRGRPPGLGVLTEQLPGALGPVGQEEEQLLGRHHAGALREAQPGAGQDPHTRASGLEGVGQAQAQVVVQVRGEDDLLAGAGPDPGEHLRRLGGELVADSVRQDHGPRAGRSRRRRVGGHQGMVRPGGVRQADVHRHLIVQPPGLLDERDPRFQGLAGRTMGHHLGHRLRGGHDHHHPGVGAAAHRRHGLADIRGSAAAYRGHAHRALGLHRQPPYRLELLRAHGREPGGEHHVPRSVTPEDPPLLDGQAHPEGGRHQCFGLRAVTRRLLPQHDPTRQRGLPHQIPAHDRPISERVPRDRVGVVQRQRSGRDPPPHGHHDPRWARPRLSRAGVSSVPGFGSGCMARAARRRPALVGG